MFGKYLDNTCTREEFEEIFSYMQDKDGQHVDESIEELYTREFKFSAQRRINYRPVLSVAAAILVLVIAGAAWMLLEKPKQQPVAVNKPVNQSRVTKETHRSEYKYLLLPDSTQVWLNAASTLEFPETFGNKKREVYLKGEAYFDVKHADKIPFIIYTGHVSTEVLGTAFNIKAYPDLEKITVSVKRGKVKVNYENEQVAMLTRGEQVSIGSRDKKIKEKSIREEDSSAWHEGNLVYDDYSVADILNDLERIYDVKINVVAPEIKQMRVSTSFKREYGVETALEILCRLTDTRTLLKDGIYNISNHIQN